MAAVILKLREMKKKRGREREKEMEGEGGEERKLNRIIILTKFLYKLRLSSWTFNFPRNTCLVERNTYSKSN